MVSPLCHQATLNGLCYKTHTGLRIGTSNNAPLLAIFYLLALLFFMFQFSFVLSFCIVICLFSMLKFSATNRYKQMFFRHSLSLTTTQSLKFLQQESNPHSQKKEFSFFTNKLWEQIIHLGTIAKIHKM